jgi:hypothetical protein
LVPSIIRLSSSSWFRFRSCSIDMSKAGHEPARAELGPSHALARRKSARLGLARFADEPEK